MTPVRRTFVKYLHQILSLAYTSRGKICLYGWPDYEENTLSAAVLLAETGKLRVTLLVEDPKTAHHYLSLVNDGAAPVEIVSKATLRGLLEASAAEAILFTHGLYGSPDFRGRKLVVNLWHGYGPKANDNALFSARIPFDVLICDTPVWGGAAARWLGAPEARIVPTGNPRQVAMKKPPAPAALARLGLAASGFVVWMPTYRATNGARGDGGWRDAPDLGSSAQGDSVSHVARIASLAEAAGVQLVVKPHPLDAGRYGASGLRVITTDEIFRSGMTMYQFIGASAGMISDYSSIWVEYLALDRPLALYCPDIREYIEGRGFSEPKMTDIVRELIVERDEDVGPFLEAVASGKDWRPEARQAARGSLALAPSSSVGEAFTSAILKELDRHRASRSGLAASLMTPATRLAAAPTDPDARRTPQSGAQG